MCASNAALVDVDPARRLPHALSSHSYVIHRVRMVKQQTKMSIAKVQANITKREEGEVNLLSRSLEIH
jgi:hypothetical protein